MSVINQMLKDLDERKTAAPATPYEPAMSRQSKTSKLPWIIVAVLSVILVAWAFRDLLPVQDSTSDRETLAGAADSIDEEKIVIARVRDASTQQPQEAVNKKATEEATETIADIAQTETQQVVADTPEPISDTASAANVPADQNQDNMPTDGVSAAQSAPDIPTTELATSDSAIAEKATEDSSTEPRVVKVSPQQALRAEAQALVDGYRAQNGILTDAQFMEVLSLDPEFHTVRIDWLSQLNQQKDSRFEAQSLSAIQRWPAIYQYKQMLARHWVMAEPEKAYNLLTDQPPTISQAPDYHGLIAYSAKQMGNLTLASKQYQLLLKSYPERADWWLSLALTEDQLQRTASALRAYQQSLRFPGLATNIQAYAEERIKALQGY